MKEGPKHMNMELIVQLDETKAGHHKVVDWITGQDISHLVYKITLTPGEAKAHLFRVDEDGHFYKQNETVARYHRTFPIVKIYGKSFPKLFPRRH
ncbi:hypothetical protein GTO27_06890 [Candidatus Bathyarchaeota archaeon]|nr:hypothetical protein [Candidatus Bathyarchaeota archaeon]